MSLSLDGCFGLELGGVATMIRRRLVLVVGVTGGDGVNNGVASLCATIER